MAASLLAGLARIGSGLGRAAATGARGAARSGAKKIAVKKIKSKAKERISSKDNQNKKLSKKSALISSKGDRLEEKLLRSKISEEETTPTLTGTPKKLTIKSAPKSESQIEQLKINVTNIHKFLVKSNRDYARVESKNKRLSKRAQSKIKLGREERQLEKERSPFGKSLKNVKDSVASGAGSMFEKVLEFGALLLAGIIVNALPAIIEKVQEIIDNIVNFLTPIQSGFNLIKGFFTGEIDQSKYDADKKRFSDGMDNINEQLDKISEKSGPLEKLAKMFKPVVTFLSTSAGGKKIVLAKQDKKEGVLNKETEEFTERQFTAGERKKFEQKRQQKSETTTSSDRSSLVEQTERGSGPSMGSQARGNYGPHTKAFLDTIAFAEGTYDQPNSGYNTHFAFDRTENLSAHPALIKSGGGYRSDAFGRYQFMSPTWAGLGGAVNPHDGKPFKPGRDMSPANQDWGAVQLTLSRLRSAGYKANSASDLERILKSEGLSKRFAAAMSGEWASFPNTVGVSAYGQPVKKLNSLQNFFGKIIKQPKITPTPNNKGDQAKVLNQPDPRKNRRGRTVALQQVNTIQTAYVPMPIPMKSKSFSSSSSPQLPSIWA